MGAKQLQALRWPSEYVKKAGIPAAASACAGSRGYPSKSSLWLHAWPGQCGGQVTVGARVSTIKPPSLAVQPLQRSLLASVVALGIDLGLHLVPRKEERNMTLNRPGFRGGQLV